MTTLTPIALALGRIPSGIFILTAAHAGEQTGMLASWVMQAGFDPPTLSVAVARKRYLAEWLSQGAAFGLSIVGHNDRALLKHFGRGFEQGQNAFEGLALEHGPSGTPLLADALATLECRPTGHLDTGDHRLFVAEILWGRVQEGVEPLVHLRRNGLGY